MRYYRLADQHGQTFLGVEVEEGKVVIITSLNSFCELANIAYILGVTVDDLAYTIIKSKKYPCLMFNEVYKDLRLIRPLDPPEIWGAGVTYELSKVERERESNFAAECYRQVYRAARPEIYFKATAHRCVGPYEEIGIRGDSAWNVPEPELAFILYKGQIIGYTVGNDVCSRSIEGENPLYLPQAKIYDRCCAIGPCIASTKTILDPHKLKISCTIYRGSKKIFSGETSTNQMVRTCQELASAIMNHNAVPDFTVVLTGTGIIPPPEFTLQPGDIVRITIEKIGTLENVVVEV